MNPAHIHLMLNHFPLFGALAGTILFAVSLILRKQVVARAGLIVIVLTGILSLIVYLTGEPAEELVENLPGVNHDILEAHEEVSLVATIIMGAFGVVGIYGLLSRHAATMGFVKLLLVLSLVPLGAMAYTSYLGGQVRHSEIRPGGAEEAGAEAPAAEGATQTEGPRE